MCLFALGFIFGMACQYWLMGQTVDREARHIREAEDTAAIAWGSNGNRSV